MTAESFLAALYALRSDEEQKKIQRYFKSGEGQYGHGDQFIGVKMGSLFELAKAHGDMPVAELEKLLESPVHEARAGAISIMDKASRQKKIAPGRLREFFDLYIRRHDRVNNWDLVDLGCLNMTGFYLFDKPRDILYRLAGSDNPWERRSAIVSTCYFIRKKDVDDTFRLAMQLLGEPEDIVSKGTGWMLRFAGDVDRARLVEFLDDHAERLPQVALSAAVEKLSDAEKKRYRSVARKARR